MERVQSPDGRGWEVRVSRVRLPPWRDVENPFEQTEHPAEFLLHLVALPFVVLVFPLILFLLELPVSVVRGLARGTRWVEAVCWWPTELRITWRTSRQHADGVAGEVARGLAKGYERFEPANAVRVSLSRPEALVDRD